MCLMISGNRNSTENLMSYGIMGLFFVAPACLIGIISALFAKRRQGDLLLLNLVYVLCWLVAFMILQKRGL